MRVFLNSGFLKSRAYCILVNIISNSKVFKTESFHKRKKIAGIVVFLTFSVVTLLSSTVFKVIHLQLTTTFETQDLWAFNLQVPQLYPLDVTPARTKELTIVCICKVSSSPLSCRLFLKAIKGQLISKCLFGIFNPPKKRTKIVDFTAMVPQV